MNGIGITVLTILGIILLGAIGWSALALVAFGWGWMSAASNPQGRKDRLVVVL